MSSPSAPDPTSFSRRDALRAAAGLVVAGAAARAAVAAPQTPAPARAPVAFVGHGSPMTALDPAKGGEWQRWAQGWAKPSAILVVSAHWEAAPATLGAVRTVPLIYDFSGFPRELYQVRYAAPGAPALAERVKALLQPRGGVRHALARGLDHGAWVPLVWMARGADVPVLQLSLPTQDGPALVALGQALAPLRDENVVILASGNLTHNLRRIDSRPNAPTPSWAAEHDAWLAETLARRDVDALAKFRETAPALEWNHPTLEHLTPLFVAVGAAGKDWRATSFPLTGFEAGSLSRRCVNLA